MKKQIITITLTLLSSVITLQAQESNFAFFQVENSNYLILEQYIPNAILETYSTPQGGVKLGEIKINETGKAQQLFNLNNTPAFLLNRKSSLNPFGNNNVQQLSAKEFIAKDIHLSIIGNEAVIDWQAQIPFGNDIEFQIQKSVNAKSFTTIKTVKGNVGDDFNQYSFATTYNNQTVYRIQIVSGGKHLRYTSEKLTISNASNSIEVYPTIFTNQIFVIVPNTIEPATFLLSDINGKVVRKGSLNELYQTISDLESLPTGNYIMQVNQGIEKQSFKLIKQ